MESQSFVDEGVRFQIEQEAESGLWVADLYLPEHGDAEEGWYRVVGRFANQGEAITAAKSEIRNSIS